MADPYKHWQGDAERGTLVVRKRQNKVHIPDELEGARSNHVYANVVDENGAPSRAYVAVPYEREANDFPKMLFHPAWHKEPKPIANDFKELGLFQKAVQTWERKFERFKMVENDKEEKRLIAKGWLARPPVLDVPKDDPQSDEI
jgi:hypothetical protein